LQRKYLGYPATTAIAAEQTSRVAASGRTESFVTGSPSRFLVVLCFINGKYLLFSKYGDRE
jgi:hypothetical protein